MTKSISIIFPTFNNWSLTEQCLRSMNKLIYPKDKTEIIVVDNHSKDQTVVNIKKKFPRVKILPQKTNLGFAKAINVAAKQAKGYFLFITNNDVTFTPDFFDKLITFANSDPKIGVCGGKITTTMANIKYLDGAANISKLTSRLKKLKNYQKVQEVDWISGSGLFDNFLIF